LQNSGFKLAGSLLRILAVLPAEIAEEPGFFFDRQVLDLMGVDDGAGALEKIALVKSIHKPPGITEQPHDAINDLARTLIERRSVEFEDAPASVHAVPRLEFECRIAPNVVGVGGHGCSGGRRDRAAGCCSGRR
jgi:hypothetical protein